MSGGLPDGMARLAACAASPCALHPLVDSHTTRAWCRNDECVILARLRLGLPLYAGRRRCNMCPARAPCDTYGRHSLVCLGGGYRTRVHNFIRDRLAAIASQGLCAPRLEQHVFPREPMRRCDIVLDGAHDGGRPIVIDVVTTSPFAARQGAAAATSGGAAQAAEERKRASYVSLPDRYAFHPVGYDMLGAPGPSAKALLQRLSGRVADRHGQPRPTTLLYHRVEMQAAVQIMIARTLLVNMEGDGSGRGLAVDEPPLRAVPPANQAPPDCDDDGQESVSVFSCESEIVELCSLAE